jgi:hypothetical protein
MKKIAYILNFNLAKPLEDLMKMKILLLLALFTITPLVAMHHRDEALEAYHRVTCPNEEKIFVYGAAVTSTFSVLSLVSAYKGHTKTAIGFGAAAAVSVAGTGALLLWPPR